MSIFGDLESLIRTVGYLGIFAIVFAESGIMVGFFLPGDTLLFTAGVLASQHYLHIAVLLPLIFIGAIAGDNSGYLIGRKAGPKLFNRDDSTFFKKMYLQKTQAFFAKHGVKTIIIARFVPVIRTFAAVMAGAGAMKYKKFLFYDILGAF